MFFDRLNIDLLNNLLNYKITTQTRLILEYNIIYLMQILYKEKHQ